MRLQKDEKSPRRPTKVEKPEIIKITHASIRIQPHAEEIAQFFYQLFKVGISCEPVLLVFFYNLLQKNSGRETPSLRWLPLVTGQWTSHEDAYACCKTRRDFCSFLQNSLLICTIFDPLESIVDAGNHGQAVLHKTWILLRDWTRKYIHPCRITWVKERNVTNRTQRLN